MPKGLNLYILEISGINFGICLLGKRLSKDSGVLSLQLAG